MGKVKKVRTDDILPVVKEILDRGGITNISVSGASMIPFLHKDEDRVELSSVSFNNIQRGDIVLIVRDSGEYVLHRVLRKEKEYFYIVGDAQQWIEGPLRTDQLIAVATAVWRKERRIECSAFWWRGLAELWMLLRPMRNHIFRLYRLLKRIL